MPRRASPRRLPLSPGPGNGRLVPVPLSAAGSPNSFTRCFLSTMKNCDLSCSVLIDSEGTDLPKQKTVPERSMPPEKGEAGETCSRRQSLRAGSWLHVSPVH